MKIATTIWIISAAVAFYAQSATAAWSVTPSAELRADYDDNVRLAPDAEDGEAIVATLTAQAQVQSVTERSAISAIVGANLTHYSDYSGPGDLRDRDEEFLALGAVRGMEKSSIGISANFTRDDLFRELRLVPEEIGAQPTGPTAGADLLDPGEISVIDPNDVDTGTVQGQVRRNRLSVSPNYRIDLGARTDATLAYTYSKEDLKFSTDDPVDLIDAQSHAVSLGLRRDLTERNILEFSARASKYDPDDRDNAETYELRSTWRRAVSERTAVLLEFGVRHTDRGENDDTGFLVRARGERSFERGSLSAEFERSVTPNAFGDIVENDRITLAAGRRFSERWSGTLLARAFRTDTILAQSFERDFVQASAEIRWIATPSLSVSGAYLYRWIDRETIQGTADGNVLSISLAYRPPIRLR